MDPGNTIARITGLTAGLGHDVRVEPCEICADPLPEAASPIALANLDVDLLDAIGTALDKLAPRMARRGVVIVEDPTSVPGLYGAYVAMRDFLDGPRGRDFVAVRGTSQYFLVRTG